MFLLFLFQCFHCTCSNSYNHIPILPVINNQQWVSFCVKPDTGSNHPGLMRVQPRVRYQNSLRARATHVNVSLPARMYSSPARRYSPLMPGCLPAQIYSSPPSEMNSWTRRPIQTSTICLAGKYEWAWHTLGEAQNVLWHISTRWTTKCGNDFKWHICTISLLILSDTVNWFISLLYAF